MTTLNVADGAIRTDIDAPIPYRQNKHVLFGQQEGRCNGCGRWGWRRSENRTRALSRIGLPDAEALAFDKVDYLDTFGQVFGYLVHRNGGLASVSDIVAVVHDRPQSVSALASIDEVSQIVSPQGVKRSCSTDEGVRSWIADTPDVGICVIRNITIR